MIWYSKFLEARFKRSWTAVTREALKYLGPTFNEPQPDEIGRVYNYMSVVAKLLLEKGRRELALVDITDEADNLHLIKDQRDGGRAIPDQLAFAAVGWLSKSVGSFSPLTMSNA